MVASPVSHAMTGAAVAQAAMMAQQQQIPTSLGERQNAAFLAAHTAMAQAQNQKQLDDLNRAVMMQRFQQAAAAGARPGGPPGMGMVRDCEGDLGKLVTNWVNFFLADSDAISVSTPNDAADVQPPGGSSTDGSEHDAAWATWYGDATSR